MLTVGAFLGHAIPDDMLVGVFEERSDEYNGIYDVFACDKEFGHRQLASFDIRGGCLIIYLEEEKS